MNSIQRELENKENEIINYIKKLEEYQNYIIEIENKNIEKESTIKKFEESLEKSNEENKQIK